MKYPSNRTERYQRRCAASAAQQDSRARDPQQTTATKTPPTATSRVAASEVQAEITKQQEWMGRVQKQGIKLLEWVNTFGECYVCCSRVEGIEDLAVFACGHAVHKSCLTNLRVKMCEEGFNCVQAIHRIQSSHLHLTQGGALTPELEEQLMADLSLEPPSRKAAGMECGICSLDLRERSAVVLSPPMKMKMTMMRHGGYSIEHFKGAKKLFACLLHDHTAFLKDLQLIQKRRYTKHLSPPANMECVVA